MGKPSKRKVQSNKKPVSKKRRKRVGDDEPALPAGTWRVRCLDPFDNPVDVEFPVALRYFRGNESGPSWGIP